MLKIEGKCAAIGIDIGGTNTVIGIVDAAGNSLCTTSLPTLAYQPASEFITRLVAAIEESLRQLPREYTVKGIGIAVPAANYYQGTVESPSNFNWGKVDFVAMMQEYYNFPIAITNDAKAAAIGEMKFGAARGMENFVVITLGTGLGCGVVEKGKVLFGEKGLAGELGHVIIEPNGRFCNCERRGCLETYVSANGICRTAFELMCNHLEESELRNIENNKLTAEKIYELALRGDILALEAFKYTGLILGCSLANVAANYSPEAIIISGGLAKAGNLLLDPTREYFRENLLNIYKGQVSILLSQLQDGKAAVLGSSALILDKVDHE